MRKFASSERATKDNDPSPDEMIKGRGKPPPRAGLDRTFSEQEEKRRVLSRKSAEHRKALQEGGHFFSTSVDEQYSDIYPDLWAPYCHGDFDHVVLYPQIKIDDHTTKMTLWMAPWDVAKALHNLVKPYPAWLRGEAKKSLRIVHAVEFKSREQYRMEPLLRKLATGSWPR
jgi:hypothetical protein